jgi:hypothetical protein
MLSSVPAFTFYRNKICKIKNWDGERRKKGTTRPGKRKGSTSIIKNSILPFRILIVTFGVLQNIIRDGGN